MCDAPEPESLDASGEGVEVIVPVLPDLDDLQPGDPRSDCTDHPQLALHRSRLARVAEVRLVEPEPVPVQEIGDAGREALRPTGEQDRLRLGVGHGRAGRADDPVCPPLRPGCAGDEGRAEGLQSTPEPVERPPVGTQWASEQCPVEVEDGDAPGHDVGSRGHL